MKSEPDQRPELAVRNLQRRHRVDPGALRSFLRELAETIGVEGESATLALVSDDRIRVLNRDYRGLDRATDVLSFGTGGSGGNGGTGGGSPAGGVYLGDIVISVETAFRQARRRGTTLEKELRLLTLHGFLHLLGYDHETDDGEMRRIEYRLRQRFRITNGRRNGRGGR